MHDLAAQLGDAITIGSGAVGTYILQETQLTATCVELLNLDDSDVVVNMHERYREAGARVLLTNTFAANPLRLEEVGRADQCEAINAAGVRLARGVAGRDSLVWASVGPLNLGLRADDFSDAELLRLYARQCGSLRGADALVLETQHTLREARAALRAAADTGRPVIFQVGHLPRGDLRWVRAHELVAEALRSGVQGVGTNCAHPLEIVQLVEFLSHATDLPITASPNAGNPDIDRGQVIYDFPPEDFVRVARDLVDAGACVVGGCCGTTPRHIRAIRETLQGRRPVPASARQRIRVRERTAAPVLTRPPNRIRDLMRSADRFVVSVEVRPLRTRALADIVRGARVLAAAGADLFDVPDNAAATVGRDSMVTAAAIQRETGKPALSHKTVTQSNVLHLHSELLGCWDLGLQGLLAITGDVPRIGHMAALATRVGDLRSSVELLRLVARLRAGELITGDRVADAPDFCAGCGMGSGRNLLPQVRWLGKKLEAGAEFVFTQPVFSVDQFERLRDATADLPIRMLPGLLPLTGARNAHMLAAGRIPGIEVPEDLAASFDAAADPVAQREQGLRLAIELARALRARGSSGLYVIMPFGKTDYEDTARLLRAVREA